VKRFKTGTQKCIQNPLKEAEVHSGLVGEKNIKKKKIHPSMGRNALLDGAEVWGAGGNENNPRRLASKKKSRRILRGGGSNYNPKMQGVVPIVKSTGAVQGRPSMRLGVSPCHRGWEKSKRIRKYFIF